MDSSKDHDVLAILLVVMLVSVGMGLQLCFTMMLLWKIRLVNRQHYCSRTLLLFWQRHCYIVKRLDSPARIPKTTPMTTLVEQAGTPVGKGGNKVPVKDMLVGGSGASAVMNGTVGARGTSQGALRY